MQKRALKKVVVLSIYPEETRPKTEQLKSNISDVIEVLFGTEEAAEHPEELINCLFLVDEETLLAPLLEAGCVVAGYEHEENGQHPMTQVDYVLSEIESLEVEDFVYVWNRLTGQPCEILETERLLVRETTLEDVDRFYALYQSPSITCFMEPLYDDPEEEKAYQEMYIQNIYGLYGYGIWTVILKDTGEVIGRAGIAPREGCSEPELGFVIGESWQRQGLGYEVCEAILAYGRAHFQIEQVVAVIHEENLASRKLVEKLGFHRDQRILQENHVTYLLSQC